MATLALLELLPEPQFAALARHLPAGAELRAVASTDDAEARRLAAEADILLVWNGPLPSATLAAARQARLAQVCERRPRGVDFFAACPRRSPSSVARDSASRLAPCCSAPACAAGPWACTGWTRWRARSRRSSARWRRG